MRTVFLRVLEAEDKAAAILAAVRQRERTPGYTWFQVDSAEFALVPRSPFAYWAGESLLGAFTRYPLLQSDTRRACAGAVTNDNARFVRVHWEVASESRWSNLAKGGGYSPFYADIHLVIDWANDGREIKAFVADFRAAHGWTAHWAAELHNASEYLRPGITWPLRTLSGLGMRVLPRGCVFGHKGPTIFVDGDPDVELLALLAIVCSSTFRAIVDLHMTAASYEVGVIQRTPVPPLTAIQATSLASLARRAWSLKRMVDTSTETSHAFCLPALLRTKVASLAERSEEWSQQLGGVEGELRAIQSEIDERCFALYAIDDADRMAITRGFGGAGQAGPDRDEADPDGEDAEANGDRVRADVGELTAEFLSWTVGVAFGRFDVGAESLPVEPEPFGPLPVCSPGMLAGGRDRALERAPAGYPIVFPETGILIDEAGHPRDMTAAVRAVFDLVFGDRADTMWSEASSLLDPKTHDLRAWLANSFFDHHLTRYSKSRRKAPIYWPLSTASGGYTVWLYAHRLTTDSLLLVQNDLLAPKLALEERKLGGLIGESAHDRTERGRQQDFVDELRAMREELARVAPLFRPTLDDGIVLVKAPLWRLVRHKPWQKELHLKWDELVEGTYDWAQIAMHLWPERVVPKCADDRSLAIAHGLEDVFWLEDVEGKWQRRQKPTKPVAALVAERSSVAVKAALRSLVDAPTPGAAGKAGGKRAKGKS